MIAPVRIDREQLLRLLTFWLRPDFVLRVVARFQSVAGFDRSMGLASSAMTATIPITILVGALLPVPSDTASRIIERYELSGDGAEAVRDAFQPISDVDTSLGIIGFLLLVFSLLSFTRAMQRLIESAWELAPMSIRNTVGGAKWLLALILYLGVTGVVVSLIDVGPREMLATIAVIPITFAFFIWSAMTLSSGRLKASDVIPFAAVAAVLLALYEFGASFYTPTAFNSYASRYGVIGVVFAMISALFGLMLAIVASAAVGREVRVELDNIRDGIRPSDDEIKKQWDIVIEGARIRRDAVREQLGRLRRTR